MKMKHSILTYGLTTLFAIGFAGFAYGFGVPPLPQTGGMAMPVFLDGILGKKEAPVQKKAEHPIHNDETFNDNNLMVTREIVPYQKVQLGFSMRIPKDWAYTESYEQKTETDLNQRLAGNIARFDSPRISTYQPRIIVQALEMPHEISAEHWLRHHILISGYTPIGDIESKGPREASGHYIYLEGDDSIYVYIRALINKNNMLLAKFEMPAQLKDYMKFLQHKTIDSFAISYLEDDPIEEQKSFTLIDSIKLNFPGSWLVTDSDFRDMNRLVVNFKNMSESGSLQGFIHVMAVRRNRNTSLQMEIEGLKKNFEDTMKIEFVRLETSRKAPVYDRFIFNRYETYEIKNKQRGVSSQKLHLVILGDKEWYIVLYLLTPREDDNLYNWARNVASFESILRSLK